MLDAVTDAALTLAPDGGITSANRAAATLFALDAAAPFRRTVFDLLTPADHATMRTALADPAAVPSSHVEGRGGDGRAVPLTMTLARAADGTACVIFRDLTAEREHERQRHELSRRIDRVRADSTGLAAWVSRELRTPTETIAALAELMRDEHTDATDAAPHAAHLRDIRAATQRILKTLDEVGDLARIESGDFTLTPVALHLNDAVEAAIAEQQPAAGRARVVIRSSLAPALPPIMADAAALRQITANLIAVSIHLANAGGQAIVSTARTDDGGVMLRLRDTGPGLTEDELASASEPLRLKPPADHATLDNAGINIALTRALIEASGATFAIRSAAASGTLIELAFKPADSAAA
jgi:signal transduction histidine kinase